MNGSNKILPPMGVLIPMNELASTKVRSSYYSNYLSLKPILNGYLGH